MSIISEHTHRLSNNFTEKVVKTQDIYLNSYTKKSAFVGFLKHLQDKEKAKKIGVDYDHFQEVFGTGKRFENFKKNLDDCGSWLEFRHYYKKDVTKLHTGNFCKKDKLCPACAVRRAYKQQQKFLKALEVDKSLINRNWYYIVIPVKHSRDEDIDIVYNRLDKVRKSIIKAINNKKNGKKSGIWGQFDGGMGSIEVTKTHNGWNVHLNLLINAPKGIKFNLKQVKNRKGQISIQNKEITQFLKRVANSQMHNISKLDFGTAEDIKSNLVEVLKYSFKFSSLNTVDLLKVYIAFYRKRLFFTFGNLWGLKLENVELENDDVIDTEFIKVIYKRAFGSYELQSVREVKEEKRDATDAAALIIRCSC